MTGPNENTTNITERGIIAERTLNAPRKLVWKVWTEPEHIKNWWGPEGFTNTIESMEVKENGVWNFIMHGPDGKDYRNIITYKKIKEPELIIYEHGPSPKFTVTVTFEEKDGLTRLTMEMEFETAELRDSTVKTFNAVEGLKQTLGRLSDYLPAIMK